MKKTQLMQLCSFSQAQAERGVIAAGRVLGCQELGPSGGHIAGHCQWIIIDFPRIAGRRFREHGHKRD